MSGRGSKRESAGGPSSIQDVQDWLRKNFAAEAAGALHVLYEITLTGPGGGTLAVRVDDGRLELSQASMERPDLRLRFVATDFFDVLAARANADMLFMEDRVGWSGDLSLALKLRRLFRGQSEEQPSR